MRKVEYATLAILTLFTISAAILYFEARNQTINVYNGTKVNFEDLPAEAKEAIKQVLSDSVNYSINPHLLKNYPEAVKSDNRMLLPGKEDPHYYLNTYVFVSDDNDTYGKGDKFGKKRIVIGKGGEFYYTPDHHQTYYRVIFTEEEIKDLIFELSSNNITQVDITFPLPSSNP